MNGEGAHIHLMLPKAVFLLSMAGKGKKSTKTAKKMTKKKKTEETKLDDDQLGDSDEENKTNNNNNNLDEKEDSSKEKKNLITDLNHYKPAFRELDIEVSMKHEVGITWYIVSNMLVEYFLSFFTARFLVSSCASVKSLMERVRLKETRIWS